MTQPEGMPDFVSRYEANGVVHVVFRYIHAGHTVGEHGNLSETKVLRKTMGHVAHAGLPEEVFPQLMQVG